MYPTRAEAQAPEESVFFARSSRFCFFFALSRRSDFGRADVTGVNERFWHGISSKSARVQRMLKKSNTRDEILVQAEAFSRMNGNELELIQAYAADFRRIITDFESVHGRVPTADDLLSIESLQQGRDITE